MSKDPAVLFYTSDFISGTLTMTDEQKGKYIILLCLQHQQGTLTKEDMMNICKTYDSKIFSKFIKNDDGSYYNERMKIEADKRSQYSQSRSKNRKNICKSYDEHMENENINISEILLKEILKRKPDFKKPDLKKWAENIDLMTRIDKRTLSEIKKVIFWCQQDSFWKNNILSTEKLRKQYDQLVLKMNGGDNGNSKGFNTYKGFVRTDPNWTAKDDADVDAINRKYYAQKAAAVGKPKENA